MNYAERAYFEGDHCHHCAARAEALRLAGIREAALRAIRQRPIRAGELRYRAQR